MLGVFQHNSKQHFFNPRAVVKFLFVISTFNLKGFTLSCFEVFICDMHFRLLFTFNFLILHLCHIYRCDYTPPSPWVGVERDSPLFLYSSLQSFFRGFRFLFLSWKYWCETGHTGRETVTRRDATFQFLKTNKITLETNIWRFCMH